MISGKDAYEVMAAMVPLYVAMFLAYGSVRWWGIFTPVQCSGINRFVAMFAVPVLSFHIIGTSNMYTMNYTFIAADTLQKVAVLVFLAAWSYAGRLLNRGPRIGIEWGITLFSLSTLPNTLIIGIPLLKAMYGESAGNLMVQVIVFQGVVWYNVLLVLFECRAAKILISEQFPRGEAEKIASVRVDSDVASLGGLEPLETEAETDREGRLHVRVRRSYGSASSMNSFRLSNLSGVEIYSVQSMSPTRVPSFNYGSGRHETVVNGSAVMPVFIRSSSEGLGPVSLGSKHYEIPMALAGSLRASSERCPPKPPSVNGPVASGEFGAIERYSSSVRFDLRPERHAAKGTKNYLIEKSGERSENGGSARRSSESVKITNGGDGDGDYECGAQEITDEHRQMPAASVMAKLIFVMVWRKLTRNPNTYASFLGVVWSLVSKRWHVEFPSIIENSIQIISDTGLGMAVFSLGLFMALRPKIISCGKKAAATSMGMKFLVGPTLMAATSLAIGIRGTLLHVAIIQAALPQGIVPFVFAKEYDVHADILSTSVIFGMMIALPITIIYNIFLEL